MKQLRDKPHIISSLATLCNAQLGTLIYFLAIKREKKRRRINVLIDVLF